MPRLGPVLGREGPLVDREHRMLKPCPTPFGALMSAPVISPGAQRGATVRGQPRWPLQSRFRLIDGLVNALVTQPHPRLPGELQPQVTADLLWAPPLAQKLRDQLPQFAVGLDASPMVAGATRGRATVGIERTVTSTPVALRRSSRETVEGARPSRCAICRMLKPA